MSCKRQEDEVVSPACEERDDHRFQQICQCLKEVSSGICNLRDVIGDQS